MSYERDRIWWGHKRWEQAFATLSKASKLIEKTVQSGYEAIETGEHEAEIVKYEDAADAEYDLVDGPASCLRAGLFCQVVAEFEYSLLFLCVNGSRVINGGEFQFQNNRKNAVVHRLRFLGELTNRDFLAGSEVLELQAIRNLITHTTGETLTMEHNRRELLEARLGAWAKAHPELASISIGGVIVYPRFLGYAAGYYNDLMTRIVQELSQKADCAIAARAIAGSASTRPS